ncbi:zinc ribbon domain-containing protein [Streptomyces sp. NPDC089424]|uniref:FmdB family zinc ribbon protein n=1 Tax=Streptomyces sp. NPDC089424 TaxID=3365917 RepID=UPI00380B84DE
MATYEYSCNRCGSFDVKRPIGTASAEEICPRCSGTSRRVFSAPATALTPPAVTALHEREEKSRENPVVVSRGPAKEAAPRPVHPAHARLPRP